MTSLQRADGGAPPPATVRRWRARNWVLLMAAGAATVIASGVVLGVVTILFGSVCEEDPSARAMLVGRALVWLSLVALTVVWAVAARQTTPRLRVAVVGVLSLLPLTLIAILSLGDEFWRGGGSCF